MNAVPGALALAIVLLPSGSAQNAPVRNQQGRTPSQPAPNRFLDGWMNELLYGDQDKARSIYLDVMKAKNLPNAQSELAILRLWETTWQERDRAFYRTELERRNQFRRERFRWDGQTMAQFSIAFARAHALNDEEQLAELRLAVAAYIRTNDNLATRRQLIQAALDDGALLPSTGPDPTLEGLKRSLQKARDDGDERLARRYRNWIEQHTSRRLQQDRRLRSYARRLLRKRLADITRFHLEGNQRRGNAGESTLRGRDRFDRVLPTYDAFVRALGLESWDAATRAKKLEEVLERLGDRSRLMAYSWRPERTVLRQLRTKLEELREAGQIAQALRLAARTPYRLELFPRRPR